MSEPRHITRREMLKRGAVVGGSVLWATPVVQTIGMGAAHAATPSPTCAIYCLTWSSPTTTRPRGWDPSDGTGCLPCPPHATAGLPPGVNDLVVTYDGVTDTYTVTYPDTFSIVTSGDPTPDDLVNGSAALRRGDDLMSCEYVDATQQMPGPVPGTTQIQFTNWQIGTTDRIDLVIEHCV